MALRWRGRRPEARREARRKGLQRLLLKEIRGRNNRSRRVRTRMDLRSDGAVSRAWKPTWGWPLRRFLLWQVTRPQPLLFWRGGNGGKRA